MTQGTGFLIRCSINGQSKRTNRINFTSRLCFLAVRWQIDDVTESAKWFTVGSTAKPSGVCPPAAALPQWSLVIAHYNLNANRVISSPAAALSSPTWWLPIDLHSSLISPARMRHHFLLIFHPCLKNCFTYGGGWDDAFGSATWDQDLQKPSGLKTCANLEQ